MKSIKISENIWREAKMLAIKENITLTCFIERSVKARCAIVSLSLSDSIPSTGEHDV